MKVRTMFQGLALGAVLLCAAGPASAATVQLGGDFEFTSSAPLETFEGTASGATGSFNIDFADLTKSTGTISVRVDSMKTGSDIRDSHLRGADWLDAGSHPEMKFELTKVEVVSQEQKGAVTIAKCKVAGNFTLKGTTQPVNAKVVLKWKGSKVKAAVRFRLRLAKYGIKGQEGVLGSKVAKRIAIKGTLTGSVQ